MSLFTGRRQEVGIAKEAPRGTGTTPAEYWLPKTNFTFDDKVRNAFVVGSYGNITDAAMTGYISGKWAEGDLEGEINVDSFGLILLALCGDESAGGDLGGGAYLHTYTLQNDNQTDSLTIHLKDPIGQMWFRMAMLNSLSIDVTLGEIVKYTANFYSKTHQTQAATSPSYSIDNRFISKDLSLKIADDISSLAAATQTHVKSLTIDFDKNVELLEVASSLEPEDIVNKGFKITGTMELNYETRAWRDYMLNNTVKAMEIKFTSLKTIGTASHPTWTMVFPKVRFDTWEPASGLDDISSQTVNFQVYYDLSNERLWSTFTLLNTVSTSY